MKERYEIAEIEVVEFDVEDVIDDSFDPFDCAEMTSN